MTRSGYFHIGIWSKLQILAFFAFSSVLVANDVARQYMYIEQMVMIVLLTMVLLQIIIFAITVRNIICMYACLKELKKKKELKK